MKSPIALVGILNLTPDSFSDGGRYAAAQHGIERAWQLRGEGADLVELGADSTRPGSSCAGAAEEWRRLEPVLKELAGTMPLALDTHHAEVARRAMPYGMSLINDVSAGYEPDMFALVAAQPAIKLVLMYSRCKTPHQFGPEAPGDLIEEILSYWEERRCQAYKAGVRPEQLIFDPGMGAFLSEKPQRSFELLGRFSELQSFGHSLMLAISRKGFTRQVPETCIEERDFRSQELAREVLEKASLSCPVYLRVHNVALHQAALARISAPRLAS